MIDTSYRDRKLRERLADPEFRKEYNKMKEPVFVFGSNEAGIHGAGAAYDALKDYGAIIGLGFGFHGNSFAIPTKDWNINTLPLPVIKFYIDRFLEFARVRPTMQFKVTRIGCGLAGYKDEDIAPMFANAPSNVDFFEPSWKNWK